MKFGQEKRTYGPLLPVKYNLDCTTCCPYGAKKTKNLSAVIPITRTDIKNLLRTKVRYCSVVSESVVICQLTLKMAEEIDSENRRISNFKGPVTLTLTLDRVIRHTVVHHSSTSTDIPNFIVIGKTFCGRTYEWMDILSPI